MKNKYRVMPDMFAGFEIQIKRWWFPVWIQLGVNTFSKKGHALAWLKNHQPPWDIIDA